MDRYYSLINSNNIKSGDIFDKGTVVEKYDYNDNYWRVRFATFLYAGDLNNSDFWVLLPKDQSYNVYNLLSAKKGNYIQYGENHSRIYVPINHVSFINTPKTNAK